MIVRIDAYATHEQAGYRYRQGRPMPFGATVIGNGVNFSVFSSRATSCSLVLFEKGAPQPLVEIDIPPEFRIGNVYAITVFDLRSRTWNTAFASTARGIRIAACASTARASSPTPMPAPWAAATSGGRSRIGTTSTSTAASIVLDDFDWEGDRPLELPMADLIVYEMHVRGYTATPRPASRRPERSPACARRSRTSRSSASTASSCCRSSSSTSSKTAAPIPRPASGWATTGATARSASSRPRRATRQPGATGCRSTNSRRWSRSCTATASRSSSTSCSTTPPRAITAARHLLPRDRQPDVLHAHAGRLVLEFLRLRQHAQLQ